MDLHHIIIAATEVTTQAAETHEASGGILGTLGIDLKLFIAQLVNFAIVLLVFWKWVLPPLTKALSDRQTKIESALKNATYMEDEKQKFEDWKKKEIQKVRTEAEKVMKMSSDTAEKIRQETVTEAQAQASKLIEQSKSAIEFEKKKMLQEVKASVAELVTSATEKVIRAKLDTKKDHELVSNSVKEIT